MFLNYRERDYSITGEGIFDDFHIETLKPLETAKVYFNFTGFPDKLLYNDHVQIKIENAEGEEYDLPYYLSNDNNRVTNKNDLITIRIFNWTPLEQTFKVGLSLYHGLFIPTMVDLADKVWIEKYQSERQTRQSNFTHGAVIGDLLMDGKTIPYNCPDYGLDPNLWLDFVSTGPGINPTTKNLDKDAHDSTYWQSK